MLELNLLLVDEGREHPGQVVSPSQDLTYVMFLKLNIISINAKKWLKYKNVLFDPFYLASRQV